MNVLVVTQYYWPESFRITEVVKALNDEGCKVCVLTGQPNYPDGVSFCGYRWWKSGKEICDGIEVFRVPLLPRGNGSAFRLVMNYLSFIIFASIFAPFFLRGRKVDRIFVFGVSPILQAIPAIFLAKIKSAKIITWVQDLWPETLRTTGFVRNAWLLKAVERVVRWIYRNNDLLLVQSCAFIDSVKKMAGTTPVIYHPNPGDFAFSSAIPINHCPIEFGLKFSVVFAGNLGTVQSIGTILDAAELLRGENVEIFFIGSGSRSEWLNEEVIRRQLDNVKLPGRFPVKTMPVIMSKSSVLLVSLVRSEVMSKIIPSKIQAYLAAGRPIIASLDGEGARIVLDAQAGITCPAEDASALSSAIRMLERMPAEQLAQMGLNGRHYYEHNFEPHMLARKLVAQFFALGR